MEKQFEVGDAVEWKKDGETGVYEGTVISINATKIQCRFTYKDGRELREPLQRNIFPKRLRKPISDWKT